MTELLTELIDKWILLYAIIAVAFTEAVMRMTPEKITRWKYAILSTFMVAILLSLLHSFGQGDVTWKAGLVRGLESFVIAIAGYDVIKSLIKSLPSKLTSLSFLKKQQ